MSARAFLFDHNVWVALALGHHLFHRQATDVFREASPDRKAYFCCPTRVSVLRLLTTQAVFMDAGLAPMSNREALTVLNAWMASPSVGYIAEPPSVWDRWIAFADLNTASPKRWMDAYLAAFAIEGGLQLVSTDRAFETYPGLNPVVLTTLGAVTPAVASSKTSAPNDPGAGTA